MRLVSEHETPDGYVTYADVMREVSRLLDADDLQAALDVLTNAGPRFPSQLGHVQLFRASLTNRLGRPDEAIAILRTALDTGTRFPEKLLRGSKGLAPLTGRADFEALVVAFDAAFMRASIETPASLELLRPSGAMPARGWPLLLALHGNRSTPELERHNWTAPAGDGVLVALLGSSLPAWTPGYRVWDDRDQAMRDVTDALKRLGEEERIDPALVVLGGFSAGGLRAIEFALGRTSSVSCVVTVAAYLTDELVAELPSTVGRTDLAMHLVIGERDTCLEAHRRFAQRLEQDGVSHVFDVRPGLGHVYPDDMSAVLRRAVASASSATSG